MCPPRLQAEVRIDRLTHGLADSEIGEHLLTFLDVLAPVLDIRPHLHAVPIWRGFPGIVNYRERHVHELPIGAEDSAVTVKISNRRKGVYGQDVRDHQSYEFSSERYVRDHLNIYWYTEQLVPNWDPAEHGDPERVHTVLSRFSLNSREYGKVYIAATVSPEVLSGVTERVRHLRANHPEQRDIVLALKSQLTTTLSTDRNAVIDDRVLVQQLHVDEATVKELLVELVRLNSLRTLLLWNCPNGGGTSEEAEHASEFPQRAECSRCGQVHEFSSAYVEVRFQSTEHLRRELFPHEP